MSKSITTAPLANDNWPHRTVRCAAGLIVVATLITLAELKLATDRSATLHLAYSLFDIAVACTLFALTFTVSFRDHWRSITWISCALIVASDGVTASVHGELVMFMVTVILMVMGSGAILPWSVRWQASFNIFCVAAWSAMRLSAGRHDADEAAQ